MWANTLNSSISVVLNVLQKRTEGVDHFSACYKEQTTSCPIVQSFIQRTNNKLSNCSFLRLDSNTYTVACVLYDDRASLCEETIKLLVTNIFRCICPIPNQICSCNFRFSLAVQYADAKFLHLIRAPTTSSKQPKEL